jgi:cell division protein FtsQ
MSQVAAVRDFDWNRLRPRQPAFLAAMPVRKRIAAVVVSLLVVSALVYGLLHTKLFAVEKIDVAGLHQLKQEDVLAQAKVKHGDFLVNVRPGSVDGRLRANPWVASVHTSLDWPHGVRIDVKERTALAVAQTKDKKWAVIGEDGIVLSVSSAPMPGLPNALGVEAPTTPGERLDKGAADLVLVAGTMPESLASRVVQMQEQDGVIKLGLQSGTVVIIGDTSDLASKLTAAAAVLAKADANKLGELDVRAPLTPLSTPKSSTRSGASTSTSTTNSASSTTNSSTDKASTTSSKPSTSSTTTTVKSATKNTAPAGQTSSHPTSTTVAGQH